MKRVIAACRANWRALVACGLAVGAEVFLLLGWTVVTAVAFAAAYVVLYMTARHYIRVVLRAACSAIAHALGMAMLSDLEANHWRQMVTETLGEGMDVDDRARWS